MSSEATRFALKNIIESLLIVSENPLSVSAIQSVFDKEAAPRSEEVKSALGELQRDCESRSIEVRKIGNGYRLQTRAGYAQWIRKLHAGRPPRLSRAQLETLAIVAYRQPVTRGDIEQIRGVAVSSEIMQRLMEREWIRQTGVRDVPGRPELFVTTPQFLAYFDLESLADLLRGCRWRRFLRSSRPSPDHVHLHRSRCGASESRLSRLQSPAADALSAEAHSRKDGRYVPDKSGRTFLPRVR